MNRYYTPAPMGCGRGSNVPCNCGCTGRSGGMGSGTCCNNAGTGTGAARSQELMDPHMTATFETVTTGPARDALLEMLPLAMAYVPPQRWGAVYSAEQALQQGTLFPELDLPFEGRRRAWK